MSTFEKHLDLTTGLLLGITMILAAYAAFAGSLWGSKSVSLYSRSLSELNEANTVYLEYSQYQTELGQLKYQLSTPEGKTDTELQQDYNELKATADKQLTEYEQQRDSSQKAMKDADTANNTNDKYGLMSLLYTMVLFLGSMISVAKTMKVKYYYALGTILGLLITTGRILTLPKPPF